MLLGDKMDAREDEREWVDCYNCIDGYSHHDCGEDTCCCLHPEPNVECEICHGEGGWFTNGE